MLSETIPEACLTESDLEDRSVDACLSYLAAGTQMPVSYAYPPPEGVPWESASFVDATVRIADARKQEYGSSVHVNGFELVDAPTQVRNFHDSNEVVAVYYQEVLDLALAATGGSYGFVFDHLVRHRDPRQKTLSFGRQQRGQPPSANGRVHNDYTERSGKRRLRLVLGEGEPADSIHRFCIVNVWRSIAHPVVDAPLAVCDARTVSSSEAVAGEVRYRKRDGEIYLFTLAPQHSWYYYPEMSRYEALVFKQYDSQLSGVARFTPHAAFDHPLAPVGAPPRQSIEARVLVIFE